MDNRIFLEMQFSEAHRRSNIYGHKYMLDMISVGVVKENGESYYAISSEYDYFRTDPWVRENVIAPIYRSEIKEEDKQIWNEKTFHKYIGKDNQLIGKEIAEFVGPKPIFYGYYSSYAWVILCSMFGKMVTRPADWPKYCRDVAQIIDGENIDHELLLKELPRKNEHNALADAEWNRDAYKWVKNKMKK